MISDTSTRLLRYMFVLVGLYHLACGAGKISNGIMYAFQFRTYQPDYFYPFLIFYGFVCVIWIIFSAVLLVFFKPLAEKCKKQIPVREQSAMSGRFGTEHLCTFIVILFGLLFLGDGIRRAFNDQFIYLLVQTVISSNDFGFTTFFSPESNNFIATNGPFLCTVIYVLSGMILLFKSQRISDYISELMLSPNAQVTGEAES